MPESFYQKLDAGIRFPVRVLHAAGGIETCQSCQGGPGHEDAYHEPTIDLIASGEDGHGFAAVAALTAYGIDVLDVAIVWSIKNGLPVSRIWRIQLRRTYEDRADEKPLFTHGYWVTGEQVESNGAVVE